jgi:hypothetical protein
LTERLRERIKGSASHQGHSKTLASLQTQNRASVAAQYVNLMTSTPASRPDKNRVVMPLSWQIAIVAALAKTPALPI